MNPTRAPAAGAGIVHFGPGAFHRAHQADFIDRVLRHDPRWGITAISLRSGDIGARLERQSRRYTLAILDETKSYRTIAVHRAFFGPDQRARIRHALADPAVRLVTCTVTEKGYGLGPDMRLDAKRQDIRDDLADPLNPSSLVGWLALAMRDRREAGLEPFATLSCDNLAGNGDTLSGAVTDFARLVDPQLASWIAGEARFPNTMVDSITPATTDALRADVRHFHDPADHEPVGRELYSAWIVEDCLPPGLPDLGAAGVILTSNVAGWEQAKLRLLNGAHSTLAYLGLLLGHETVREAINDAELGAFVARMMVDDIAPTLAQPPLDPATYVGELLARFRNPAIAHRLEQIACDGSQKLPQRLVAPLIDGMRMGAPVDRLAMAVAGWIAFVRARSRSGALLTDPLAGELRRLGQREAPGVFLDNLPGVFPAEARSLRGLRDAIATAVIRIEEDGARAALGAVAGEMGHVHLMQG